MVTLGIQDIRRRVDIFFVALPIGAALILDLIINIR